MAYIIWLVWTSSLSKFQANTNTTVEIVELKQLENLVTYEFCSDDVPALGIRLEVRILHQCVVLQQRFPLLLVFTVTSRLSGELLDRYLVAVEVLEAQVAEVGRLVLF